MRRVVSVAWLLLALVASALPSWADDEGIPLEVQAVLFKKILRYDRRLNDPQAARVAVVYLEAQEGRADTLVAAFRKLSVQADKVDAAHFADGKPPQAAYFLPGADTPQNLKACQELRILSMTGSGRAVRNGNIAVGVEANEEGRMVVVVNLDRTRKLEHDLSSELLRLATLVK